jgi:hypothetical protein
MRVPFFNGGLFDSMTLTVSVLLNPSGGRRRILLNWVDERRRSDGLSFFGLFTRGEISHIRIWSAG